MQKNGVRILHGLEDVSLTMAIHGVLQPFHAITEDVVNARNALLMKFFFLIHGIVWALLGAESRPDALVLFCTFADIGC